MDLIFPQAVSEPLNSPAVIWKWAVGKPSSSAGVPSLSPYFLSVWHWKGELRFPLWNKKSPQLCNSHLKMLSGNRAPGCGDAQVRFHRINSSITGKFQVIPSYFYIGKVWMRLLCFCPECCTCRLRLCWILLGETKCWFWVVRPYFLLLELYFSWNCIENTPLKYIPVLLFLSLWRWQLLMESRRVFQWLSTSWSSMQMIIPQPSPTFPTMSRSIRIWGRGKVL